MAADVVQPSPVEVQQKLQLLKMLLASSPALKQAGDEAARESAQLARTLYTRANDALEEKNLAWADAFANEALSVIEDASRLSSTEANERSRYAEMLDDVRAFEATYLDLHKGMSSAERQTHDAQIERTHPLVAQAQAMVRDGHYQGANAKLEQVHDIYVTAINSILESTTLIYDNQFNTPAEEFEYELARYQSYDELLPLAKEQYHPNEGILQLSDRYVKDSQVARDQARQQAAAGNHQVAIQTLQGATKRLQTALKTIGLVVPE